jgi:hypothetical protein
MFLSLPDLVHEKETALGNLAWWHTLQSQLLGRWKKEDLVFKANLGKVSKILSQKQKGWGHGLSGRVVSVGAMAEQNHSPHSRK